MKALYHQINSNPKYAKAIHWSKLITITGSAQIAIQALGFICGILVIRLLSTQEYAWYTLANTMLGTMVMLGDSGISNGVMAEGGKVWQDRKKLGMVYATGLKLRQKFGLISLLVTTPVLIYLLADHGAKWFTIMMITISIIPAFYASLSDSILEIVPKLHQDINPLQKNAVQVSAGRVILSAIFIFFLPFTYIAILANSIPRLYANYKLSKIAARFADTNEHADSLVQKEIGKSISRTLPNVIYYCISGQISIWLISIFGTTNSLSELGALGRLSVIFNLVTTMFSTLVVPRFSRMKTERRKLFGMFMKIQIITIVISVILLGLTWLFSNQILMVLGKSYHNLRIELVLVTLASAIGLGAGINSQLSLSRGWYMKPYILIGFNLVTTIISLLFFNIASLRGVLWFNIIIVALHYLLTFIYGLISIRRIVEK